MSFLALSQLFLVGRPDAHPVAVRRGEVIPFAAFRRDVAAVAAHSAGQARVAVLCADSYYFSVGLLGALCAGAGVVLLPNALPATVRAMADEYDACIDDSTIDDLTIDDLTIDDLTFADLPAASAPLGPLDAERAVIHLYTSGSAGVPKKVSKNVRLLENELGLLQAAWGDSLGAGPVFSTVPHHHLYGLTFKILWPLASGRAIDTSTHAFWETLLGALTADAVVVSSPAHLARVGGIAPLPRSRCPRRVFSAGAPLSFAASQASAGILGTLPTEIFGSTETGVIATRRQTVADAAWQLFPGIRMECDGEGRLVLLSPLIGPAPLVTEDIVTPAPGGFHFQGRADRIAKIEGKRISVQEVEQALRALPLVAAGGVALSPGAPAQLVAAVVLNAEGKSQLAALGKFRLERQLRQWLGEGLEPAGIPRAWRFVETLPVAPLGKLRQADILALFVEGV